MIRNSTTQQAACAATTTLDYYAKNAEAFAQSTLDVDMSALYQAFLPLLPSVNSGEQEKVHVLDAGCGAGLAFKNLGYKVTAFDACAELADIASFHLQQPVYVKTFRQMKEQAQYHGIWCCASLLHVAHHELPDRFTKLANALKPNGVLYASFKYGEGECIINNRHYTNMTEKCLNALIEAESQLSIVDMWQSEDARPDRTGELWLNVLVRKGLS